MASVVKILESDVADGATVTVNYLNNMSYPLSTGHYVSINNNKYDLADGEIGVTLGDTSAVITNNTGRTWLSGHKLDVEFVEPENIKHQPMTQAAYDALSTKDENTIYVIVETS